MSSADEAPSAAAPAATAPVQPQPAPCVAARVEGGARAVEGALVVRLAPAQRRARRSLATFDEVVDRAATDFAERQAERAARAEPVASPRSARRRRGATASRGASTGCRSKSPPSSPRSPRGRRRAAARRAARDYEREAEEQLFAVFYARHGLWAWHEYPRSRSCRAARSTRPRSRSARRRSCRPRRPPPRAAARPARARRRPRPAAQSRAEPIAGVELAAAHGAPRRRGGHGARGDAVASRGPARPRAEPPRRGRRGAQVPRQDQGRALDAAARRPTPHVHERRRRGGGAQSVTHPMPFARGGAGGGHVCSDVSSMSGDGRARALRARALCRLAANVHDVATAARVPTSAARSC